MSPLLIFVTLTFALLVALTLAERGPGRHWLHQREWFQRLQLLEPSELRIRGTLAIGAAFLSFALLLTLRLILIDTPIGRWLWPLTAMPLAVFTVGAVALGAALYERAARLDRWG
ncbi:hypothetical protein ACNOYE_37715 [Nannocystaceae bacterium ST9]